MSKFIDYLKLLRPKQWIKNTFVFAPLFFAKAFHDLENIKNTFLAFIVFSIAASCVYIFNDLIDLNKDKLHPIKSKTRPLASGAVRPNEAKFLLALFLVVLLIILFLFHKTLFSAVILFYVFMNVLYSVSLKNKPVIDIFIISLGFVLRVIAGALSINVHVSNWMFVTTLCLTLYLAIIKRRQELKSSGEKARGVLAFYTESLLDRYADMSATGAIVFYSLYVMSANPKLILSIPFVIYGLFRYWYIVERHESGESPTDALYEDWQLVVVVLIWISVCAYVLWSS